jgi:hypothetical protein
MQPPTTTQHGVTSKRNTQDQIYGRDIKLCDLWGAYIERVVKGSIYMHHVVEHLKQVASSQGVKLRLSTPVACKMKKKRRCVQHVQTRTWLLQFLTDQAAMSNSIRELHHSMNDSKKPPTAPVAAPPHCLQQCLMSLSDQICAMQSMVDNSAQFGDAVRNTAVPPEYTNLPQHMHTWEFMTALVCHFRHKQPD